MAIKNSVSEDFSSTFVNSINVFKKYEFLFFVTT